jgi:hypothetical protein
MTWYLGAVVDAGGQACLVQVHISWAVVGIGEAAMVGCTGATMTSDWRGRSGRICGWRGAGPVGRSEGIIEGT